MDRYSNGSYVVKDKINTSYIEINTLLKKVEVGVNKDNVFVFTSPLTVTEFAKKINKSASEIIRYFLLKGQIITINTLLSEDQIAELCVNFNLDFTVSAISESEGIRSSASKSKRKG